MTSTKTALLFPGQGAQLPNMEAGVERLWPQMVRVLERTLGSGVFRRLEEGTHLVQPAVYCASLVGWKLSTQHGIDPDVYAGHSLGEIAALVAAGGLDPVQGLILAIERGRLTAEAVRHRSRGGMAAVVGGTLGEVRGIVGGLAVTVASDNAPNQVVLSGDALQLAIAVRACRERGLRAVALDVEGAFHSDAMSAALPGLRRQLDGTTFSHPRRPVYSCVSAAPFVDVRRELAASLTEMVRWREVLLALHRRGVRTFVDAGPGRVVGRLVKHTLCDVTVLSMAELEVCS